MSPKSNPFRSHLSVTALEDRLTPTGTGIDPYQPPPPPVIVGIIQPLPMPTMPVQSSPTLKVC